MNWKKLFKPSVLQTGHELVERGNVGLYSQDDNLYTGNVTGTDGRTYTVQIIDNGNAMPPSLYCNCDDFFNKKRCAHLAAFFEYLNEDQRKALMRWMRRNSFRRKRLFQFHQIRTEMCRLTRKTISFIRWHGQPETFSSQGKIMRRQSR